MGNVGTYVYMKFNYDRLNIDKALKGIFENLTIATRTRPFRVPK